MQQIELENILPYQSAANLVFKPCPAIDLPCNADPHYLIASFNAALENPAFHSKIPTEILFHDTEKAIKIKLDRILETLSQSHNRRGQVPEAEDVCFQEDSDDSCASAANLLVQKNQLIDVQELLERYCKPLPVLGFNSAIYDINLINFFCYLNSSAHEILNQWILGKLTNRSLSSLVTLNSWISWTF